MGFFDSYNSLRTTPYPVSSAKSSSFSGHRYSSGLASGSSGKYWSPGDMTNYYAGKYLGVANGLLDGVSSPTIDIGRAGTDSQRPVSAVLKDSIKTTVSGNGDSSSAAASGGTAVGGDYLGNGMTVNYLNADLAKAYGMDASTAYQEALSNTGYQRSVKDMQAAGLNPAVLFGSGYVSPASGVGYVSRAGNGYSSGASSAQSNHHFYKLLSNVGTVGAPLLTGRLSSAFAGRAVMGAIGNVLDSALGT